MAADGLGKAFAAEQRCAELGDDRTQPPDIGVGCEQLERIVESGAGFDEQSGYYRFSSGGVWFFALNTQESLDDGAPQTLWLAKELADAAAQPGYRFSIVYFHKPWVTCGDTGDDPGARARFEPLFSQYKVPLIIQAHMHGYERFEFGSITYLTIAGGGGAIGDPDANTSRPYCGRVRPPCLINLQALRQMCIGHLVADVVAIIGTLDIVLGEIDR